jgi:hypothetical protein
LCAGENTVFIEKKVLEREREREREKMQVIGFLLQGCTL